jgi:hypothetical protein
MVKLAGILLLVVSAVSGQTATRNVNISWTVSTSVGIIGYNVLRGPVGGPWLVLTTTAPTVVAYTDSTAVIGQQYVYEVVALTAPCIPTTPLTTPCGASAPAQATVNIPPQPTITATIMVIVQ